MVTGATITEEEEQRREQHAQKIEQLKLEGNVREGYRSLENSIVYGVGDFTKYFIRGGYGAVKSAFSVPTTIRKICNRQAFLDLVDDGNMEGNKFYKAIGWSIATILGAGTGVVGYVYSLHQAIEHRNPLPLAVLGVANLVNFGFEMGRMSKTKKEQKASLEIKVCETEERKRIAEYDAKQRKKGE